LRLLVTGASGQLGAYLLRELSGRGFIVTGWSGSRSGELFRFPLTPIDLTDRAAVTVAFRAARPDAVIHCAALSSIARSHREPALADSVNVEGTRLLAQLAKETRSRLLYVSTDLVFDGQRGDYREEDAPAPLSIYGRTKWLAEQAVRDYERGLVVRLSLLFGPSLIDRPSFFDEQVVALRQRRPCTLFRDEWRTPLSPLTAAQVLIALAELDHVGLLHLGGPERMSRLEMGQRLAAVLGLDASVIVSARREEVPAPEPRPRDVSVDSSRWRGLFRHLPWLGYEASLREMMP
jgi:dTDP-4-dehydrorhamnose reductase